MDNADLITRGTRVVMNTYGRYPIALVKGKGAYVWDADGKRYLDFVSGIAVCSLGHCNDTIAKVLEAQAGDLWHISNLYWIKPQIELAEELTSVSGLGKAFFCNSGAEANEAAIKLARKFFYRRGKPEKNHIIVFKNSFHGRTLATVTATGQAKYQEGFAPLPAGFRYAEFNILESVEKELKDDTCAIMVEPIQGEGGIKPADAGFLKGLRDICSQNDLLLIFDEVQCGIGRTGKMFAYQHYGVTPDILTLAKGLGSGFPIGSMLATDEASTGFMPGDHASTFGGNPLATAVAREVIQLISQPGFLNRVKETGDYLYQALSRIKDDRIIDIRGMGLMLGVEFNTEIKDLVESAIEKGLLLVGAGPRVIRLVPPLIIDKPHVDEAVGIFTQALAEWRTE
ncbi:MAG: aspartate aminotransferase family protein [Syntrophomonadaceae bacterium]|jgi:acetylornithine/N-succinyldiaminopimelate aminotransferase